MLRIFPDITFRGHSRAEPAPSETGGENPSPFLWFPASTGMTDQDIVSRQSIGAFFQLCVKLAVVAMTAVPLQAQENQLPELSPNSPYAARTSGPISHEVDDCNKYVANKPFKLPFKDPSTLAAYK